MDWLTDLVQNRYLLTSLSAWFIAQVMKVIINAIITKQLDWERLVGDGGMPSGHSATVTSLATITGLSYGLGSFQFAVTAILAIIVCHDAMGVRRETGKQAVVLNEMIKTMELFDGKKLQQVTLKEFVGHTPIQVGAGILVGILDAVAMYFLFFR